MSVAYEGTSNVDEWIVQHQTKDLLRVLTCGSVDDGKSTLIGRLLHDTKLVYEDQLAAVKRDSAKYGTVGKEKVDLALLLDGLKSEREQGITIDVAYRYFSTSQRKFIISDCPGHEQYTRNMATGASTCDLAIVLVDARHGVITQTKRHSFIVSLLGIKHVVVAVNKMDLVDFDQEVFNKIKQDYTDFAARLDLPDIHFVPISALDGDNVVDRSERSPWFKGSALLPYLEEVHIASDRNLVDFRFPVQYVIRPNLDFRGFAGTITSGAVKVGDEITVQPAGTRSKIKRITTFDGDLESAHAPQAVTLVLEDEIDCSRGEIICHPGNIPTMARSFEAMMVWMNEEPLTIGGSYWVRSATGYVPGTVTAISYTVDVNTLHREKETKELNLNQIARVTIETNRPIPVDPYQKNKATGSFVLVDRISNATAAAGMVRAVVTQKTRSIPGTTAAESRVSAAERQTLLGQKGQVIWITGLPKSGKSDLAAALERKLFDEGRLATVLDGSSLRHGLSADLGFSAEDRATQAQRMAHVAKILADTGVVVIVASVSPQLQARDEASAIIGGERFTLVYANAAVEWCRANDDEGVYAKADAGDIAELPGVQTPFEAPPTANVTYDAGQGDAGLEQALKDIRSSMI